MAIIDLLHIDIWEIGFADGIPIHVFSLILWWLDLSSRCSQTKIETLLISVIWLPSTSPPYFKGLFHHMYNMQAVICNMRSFPLALILTCFLNQLKYHIWDWQCPELILILRLIRAYFNGLVSNPILSLLYCSMFHPSQPANGAPLLSFTTVRLQSTAFYCICR